MRCEVVEAGVYVEQVVLLCLLGGWVLLVGCGVGECYVYGLVGFVVGGEWFWLGDLVGVGNDFEYAHLHGVRLVVVLEDE